MIRLLSSLCCAAILIVFTLAICRAEILAADDGAVFSLQPVRNSANRSATHGYFVYDAVPGQQLRDEVIVRNSGDTTGTARLYSVDSTTGNNGGAVYLNETDPRVKFATWIQLTESELTLNPGESRIVSFNITIPDDASAGQHLGGVVVANVPPKQGTQSGVIQIETQNRAVTAVQVNLPGKVVEQLAVTSVAVGGRQGQQTIILGLGNVGTEMVKPVGSLVVIDGSGQQVQRLPLQLDTFVPNTSIQFPVAVQKQALGAGQYRATVDLTYGTSGVTHYEGDFSITAAQVAQVFPSSASLAPPPVAATGATAAPTTTTATTQAQWPLFAGGAVLLILALAGGIFLGRGRRAAGTAK